MNNLSSREIYPKLRALDFQPVLYQGQQMWFLRDPLRLSVNQIFVPEHMAPLFAFMDGTHTSKEIHAAFCLVTGANIPYDAVDDALNRLDMACLLENDRSSKAREEQLNFYRSEPHRALALAGHGYPDQADELGRFLENFAAEDDVDGDLLWAGRGIISPHIDYQRGGQVYARVWSQASAAIDAADLVIIFGTDHNGGPGRITLTRQRYATPFGILPTDEKLIGKLAQAIGEEFAFEEELHHRDEHSIELSAVWLHHMLRRNGSSTKPMVPILVGSFHHFLTNGEHPIHDQRLNSFLEVLQKETNGRKVLAVASVDLAHVGPNFGDSFKVNDQKRSEMKKSDQKLISAALNGDAGSWFNQIAAVQDRNRICGFAPTYLLLRYLGAAYGNQIAYDQCPADFENSSLVSICGLLIN